MRWSLNDVNNLTQERLMSLSEKELGQLDRFLSDVTRKRLQYTQALGGVSPAERTLQQAGILTNNVHEATGLDRNAKIARVAKLKKFVGLKTSTKKGYESYLKSREKLTTSLIGGYSIADIIDELKRLGLYSKLTQTYKSSNGVIERIEEIRSELEDDIFVSEFDEIIASLKEDLGIQARGDGGVVINPRPEEEFFNFEAFQKGL